jgi:hypothetical protein
MSQSGYPDPDGISLTYTQNGLVQDPSAILDSTLGKRAHSDLTKPLIQQQTVQCSEEFTDYKRRRGIHAVVYIALTPRTETSSQETSPTDPEKNVDIDEIIHPLAYISTTEPAVAQMNTSTCNNKEDILTQSQMLKDTDAEQFIRSQKAEIHNLIQSNIMEIHNITDLPPNAKLISSIWSYRRKRLPDRTLLKYKARMCVNGKQQEFGRDYWETYAPVTLWASIHLMLILSSTLDLKTCQIDYTQAFPQAKLHDPVFIQIAQGWFIKEGILQQHHNHLMILHIIFD